MLYNSGLVADVLDCDIVVSDFESHSSYYVHFQINTLRKGMGPLIFPVMSQIVSVVFLLQGQL